jgi:replicative DNA helicase
MISDKLANNFIVELMSYALNRRNTFEIVKAYLKFSYLQEEPQKKLWQFISRNYDRTGRIATIGQLQQKFINNEKVLDLIEEIEDVEVEDTTEAHNSILSTFQEYLKQMMFLDSNDKLAETYNRGDKDAAYSLFIKLAAEMEKFSIIDGSSERVFGDFNKRMVARRSGENNFRYIIPTCIDELDYTLGGTNGGVETGEAALWLGASGAGKSQCLVHLGISASRQGNLTVHFQLEGTKEQCLNRYDAAWTGTLYSDMKVGEMTAKKIEVANRVIRRLQKNDIFVFSCEEWGGMSLVDVRRHCKEIEKKYGKIGCIVIDYLELLEVGDGIKYGPGDERHRQQKLAKGMKTLAMEFNAVVHTATQTNDISPEERNDPEFVITRSNLNEDKGKARPFDYVFTLNNTIDERKEGFMRIYVDKAREHAGDAIIHICNNFAYSRFYDRRRTLSMDWDEEDDD